ncbi:MAG: MFS transporter [Parasphingorhabdus sp.]|nr:MFS transporter [Parasphingorhabdus sp.]
MEKGSLKGGIQIVIVCMFANNLTMGLVFGSFGALVVANEQAFGIARDTISLAMSTFSVTMGLSALLMGGVIRRLTPRLALAIGVLASSIGFLGLGWTTNLAFAFAMWALLGFGTAMAAILAPVAIAAERFPDRAGRMLAIVNLPVVLFAAPFVITEILPILNRDGTYFVMAGLLAPVLVACFLLPQTEVAEAFPAGHANAPASNRAMLAKADFWLITLGIAIIAGTGVAFMVHAIPYAMTRGLDPLKAALMLSIYSGAGLAGVPFFGWLADKVGPPVALAVTALLQCLCWTGFAIAPVGAYLILAVILGLATTPLPTLHGAAMARLFGAASVSKAMGISYALKLPFLFSISPAVGFVYLQAGDYKLAFLAISSGLLIAVALLIAGIIAAKRRGALQAQQDAAI